VQDLTIVASHTVYSAIVGSRAYGLDGPDSDTDRRGVLQAPTAPCRGRASRPGHAHHYLGFATGQWQLFAKTGELKPALYTLRVLHTGIHLMRTGEVVADLPTLSTLPYVPDLIEAKRVGEHHRLPSDLVSTARLESDVLALTATLETTRDESKPPVTPAAGTALDDLLIRVRLHHG
jgi:predicted nucleotidyltransferase